MVKKLRDGGELTHHDETKYRELAEWVTRCRAEGAAWTTHAATTAKMTFANRRCGCASGKKCALASPSSLDANTFQRSSFSWRRRCDGSGDAWRAS